MWYNHFLFKGIIMKDNKNKVFALKVSQKLNQTQVDSGFLLFSDEEKGNAFIKNFIAPDNCEAHIHSGSIYSAYGYVNVGDFYGDSVNQRGSFFVINLDTIS